MHALLMLGLCLVGGCGRIGFELTSDGGEEVDDGGLTRESWVLGDVPGATLSGVTVDTWMCAGNPDATLNWGASDVIEGGSTCTGLLRFDLAALPAGTVVIEATLELWPILVPSEPGQVDVHRITEAWIEGSANGDPGASNYIERLPGVDWTEIGARPPGSADPASLHTFSPAALEAQVIPLPATVVQSWVDDPGQNHGLGVFGSGYGDPDSEHPHFLSREATQPELRPRLTITFDRP